MSKQILVRIFFCLVFILLPISGVQAKAPKTVKKPVHTVVVKTKKAVVKAASKTKKKVVVRRTGKNCVECKSKAEGADRSKAAKAANWSGTVIGINEGEHSYVITEGVALDHIKSFAQRSVRVTDTTELEFEGAPFDFSQLDVGARITVWGNYNAAKRTIGASRVEASSGVTPVSVASGG